MEKMLCLMSAIILWSTSYQAFNILSIQKENSDIYPMLPSYNNLLEACVETNSLNHANECLHLMERQGVGKNAVTYTILLKVCKVFLHHLIGV